MNIVKFLSITLFVFCCLSNLETQAQKTKRANKIKSQKIDVTVRQTICEGTPVPQGYYIVEQTTMVACLAANQTGRAFIITRVDAPAMLKSKISVSNSQSPPLGPTSKSGGMPTVVSGGMLNSKATKLVQPIYPPAAAAVHAFGPVNVQVLIDENGNVISALAPVGHPLLRAVAVRAAKSSKFPPSKVGGQPVRISGTILYLFTPDGKTH